MSYWGADLEVTTWLDCSLWKDGLSMDVASFCHGSEMADHEKNVRQDLEIFAPKISILATLMGDYHNSFFRPNAQIRLGQIPDLAAVFKMSYRNYFPTQTSIFM